MREAHMTIYVHQINRLRPGALPGLYAATEETVLPLATRYDVRLLGYWEVLPSQGTWPETIAVWEFDDFAHYTKVLAAVHGTAHDSDARKWMEQRGEWIASTEGLLCYKSPASPTVEELVQKGLRAVLCCHEYVQCAPARQAEYLELVEEMWWKRVAEPGGRSLIGLFWSPWKNTRAINIWGQGETWEAVNPMGTGAVWERDRNFQVWQI